MARNTSSSPSSQEQASKGSKRQFGFYRWVVLGIIFILYTIATADRANFGMALPYIKEEFNLSNSDAGLLIGFFFTFYAIGQIPCGFIYRKVQVRIVLPLAMILTSICTWFIGHTSNIFLLKLFRAGLGLAEAPLGIGCGTTINNWFPPKEKGTAMGFYFAAMKCGPVIVPPICGIIILAWGWRALFIACAIPGLIIAILWWFFVHNKPEESPFVSQKEIDYINGHHVDAHETVVDETTTPTTPTRDLCPAWLDKFIRRKRLAVVDSNVKVFTSWNIFGSGLCFMCMSGIINTIMLWIPTYLKDEKGFGIVGTGFMAAAPFVGAVLGNMIGGMISDRVFKKRRKPLMIISAISTTVMMYSLVYAPNDSLYLAVMLFLMGLLLNLSYSAFVLYPSAFTTKEVYPLAYSLVNTGGSLGGALVPGIVGYFLDSTYGWSGAFLFLAGCSIFCLLILLSIAEPENEAVV